MHGVFFHILAAVEKAGERYVSAALAAEKIHADFDVVQSVDFAFHRHESAFDLIFCLGTLVFEKIKYDMFYHISPIMLGIIIQNPFSRN